MVLDARVKTHARTGAFACHAPGCAGHCAGMQLFGRVPLIMVVCLRTGCTWQRGLSQGVAVYSTKVDLETNYNFAQAF
eukprot:9061029-Alexandrium_andersonii.AAC.1